MEQKSDLKTKINTNKNSAMIIFNEGSIVELSSYGAKDLYCCGYLTFIDGNFTTDILRDNINTDLNCKKLFAIKQAVWDIDLKSVEQCNNLIRLKNKENNNEKDIVILTKNLPVSLIDKDVKEINEILKKNKIILITDFQNEMISKLLNNNDNNYISYQYKECAVATFNKNDNPDLNNILDKSKQMLTNINFFQNNFIKNFVIKNPFLIKKFQIKCVFDKWKKLKIVNSKKRVAVFDFGISPILLNILKTYFELIVLPIDNSPKRTKFLKIDGIIISNSVVNYTLIDMKNKENIKALLNWDKPVLGIGFGGCLLGEITGNKIEHLLAEEEFNDYAIYDNNNHNYYVSNSYSSYFKDLQEDKFAPIFYDREYNNIVGIKGENKMFLTFDFLENNVYTATILNLFEEMMNG